MFISLCTTVLTAKAQETSTSDQGFAPVFQSGVAHYRAGKFEEALVAFKDALRLDPDNVQVLTNLGLTQYQLGKKGEAVALLRKARTLDPLFSTPQAALSFILPQLDVKEIPHEIQFWETVRSEFLIPFSLTGFLGLTALCFFAFGWVGLAFFGRRRRALKENLNPPAFPVSLVFITVIFMAIASLTIMKFFDLQIPRATVVVEKATIFSAPSDQAVALYDIYSGLEVVLHQTSDEWVQVTYPGASTGWIQKNNIYQTSGGILP